ncbi:hypothetical protein [Nonomuraea sp. SYSU D8015]|uniref:hypothetical protein n=1 Tax=Nonomuraea sp. SYSU D8015 TaxID=2593644 RepID=UPI001660483C|nr:hypothetical protein [Nonomuraea sp. SYSU D8015]
MTVEPIPGLRSDDAPGVVREVEAYGHLADRASESVNLIVTSPPYEGLPTYERGHNNEMQEQKAEGNTQEDAVGEAEQGDIS